MPGILTGLLLLAAAAVATGTLSGQAAATPPRHTTCAQPLVNGANVSFWTAATFTVGPEPQILLGMGTSSSGHVSSMLLLSVAANGSCVWGHTGAQMTDPRTSGCAVALSPTRVMFAGGHNNTAKYVGTIDIFSRDITTGNVSREPRSLQLPVGRELVGCATVGSVVLIAGGKPPHPPSPIGETKEIDVFHTDTNTFSGAKLSVERKKVEAVTVGDHVLMSGGEIGHHPPSPSPGVSQRRRRLNAGYSSSVDIYDAKTGLMLAPAELSLARQYFGVASAGGKAFFGGGFANDRPSSSSSSSSAGLGQPFAGFRSNLVDIYDSKTGQWSTAHLSTNRSNLAATSVMDRWVLFGGGTRQEPTKDVCGSLERSAVVDIFDTRTSKWSVECLKVGRTTMNAATAGNSAVFFGGPADPVDIFTFSN